MPGVVLTTNVVDCAVEEVGFDDRVKVTFDEQDGSGFRSSRGRGMSQGSDGEVLRHRGSASPRSAYGRPASRWALPSTPSARRWPMPVSPLEQIDGVFDLSRQEPRLPRILTGRRRSR